MFAILYCSCSITSLLRSFSIGIRAEIFKILGLMSTTLLLYLLMDLQDLQDLFADFNGDLLSDFIGVMLDLTDLIGDLLADLLAYFNGDLLTDLGIDLVDFE